MKLRWFGRISVVLFTVTMSAMSIRAEGPTSAETPQAKAAAAQAKAEAAQAEAQAAEARAQAARAQAARAKAEAAAAAAAARPAALPMPAVERLANMTPEQRQKILERIAPARREKIEIQLAKLDQLPPEQRAQLLQRYEMFQGLPQDRQVAIRLELQMLRKMSTPRLRERFSSPEFQQSYTADEQKILRESLARQVP